MSVPRDGKATVATTVNPLLPLTDSAPNIEKVRAARYSLGEENADFNDIDAPDSISIRWRLTKLKMRMPFSTSGLE